jgi:phosphotransferase system enzyme I (PtsP)
VATVAEYRAARGLLYTEAARVRPAPSNLRVGAMLEVPALLWQLPQLLRDAHFVSIGSNDLMQFLFAADRGTPALAGRYDLLSPPVLDILAHIRDQTNAAGVALSVCGEAASRPLEALTLAALGITSLSMPAASLLPIKGLLRDADLRAFRPVLEELREGATGESSLREPIASWVREHGLEA